MLNNQEKLESNKAIAKKSFEFFQNSNSAEYEKLFDSNFKLHFPGKPEPLNFQESQKLNEEYAAALPDTKITVDFQVAEGDRVVSHVTYEGRHTGEFQGVPPTNKKIKVTGVSIQQFKDGKIVEEWDEFDALGMLQQMGAIPELETIKK